MALIACAECQRSISTAAAACIHCGAPLPKLEGMKAASGPPFSTPAPGEELAQGAADPFAGFDALFDSTFKDADRTGTRVISTSSTQTYGPGDDIPESVRTLMSAAFESAKLRDGQSSTRTYGPGDEIPADVQALVNAALDSAKLAGGTAGATAGALAGHGAEALSASVSPSPASLAMAQPRGTVQSTSTVSPPDAARSVSPLLGLGIFILPPVFTWCLLRKGHTTTQRLLGFSWLGLMGLSVLARL